MATDNDELRSIFEQDQADREGIADAGEAAWSAMAARDIERRARVNDLLAAGAVETGADHFHAAMVLQHGDTLASYRQACELAATARRLGDHRGAWLAAAALDRWLVSSGRPQRYGTQYQVKDGRWTLAPVDDAVTDAERARWNVPPLAAAEAKAAAMNGDKPVADGGPTPPMVTMVVQPGELSGQDLLAVPVPWADDPVVVPLPGGLADDQEIPIMVWPGEGENGQDLWVQIVVDDGPPPELVW